MKYKILKDGDNLVNCNSYLIYNEESKEGYIIDAPSKSKLFTEEINSKKLNIKYLLLTHGHWDHILELDYWKENFGVKVVAHEQTRKYLNEPEYNLSYKHMPGISTTADIYFDGDEGQFEIFEFVRTPGHSLDGVSYKLGNVVFCGDLIFYESVGRTDLIGSNFEDLEKSIRNVIYKLDDKTVLCPGHGQNTSVEHEKIYNPFVAF